jgi:hypothetical protein
VLRKIIEALTKYIEKLVDGTPAAPTETIQNAVQEWTDRATAATGQQTIQSRRMPSAAWWRF